MPFNTDLWSSVFAVFDPRPTIDHEGVAPPGGTVEAEGRDEQVAESERERDGSSGCDSTMALHETDSEYITSSVSAPNQPPRPGDPTGRGSERPDHERGGRDGGAGELVT